MADRPAPPALDLAIELIYFGQRSLVAEPDRVLAGRGLARMHHRVLYFVARKDGLTVGDLLGALGVTKQALHRPLGDLVRLGLVRVEPDRADRRIRRLRLGTAGRRLERELTGLQHRRLAAVFREAGPAAEAGWRRVMALLAAGDRR